MPRTTLPLPPGPKGNLLLGSFLDFRKENLLDYAIALSKRYGDICCVRLGPVQKLIFISNPEYARHVLDNPGNIYDKTLSQKYVKLISSDSINTLPDNEDWSFKHRQLSKQINSTQSQHHEEILKSGVDRLIHSWIKQINNNHTRINASESMLEMTVSMISEMAFGMSAEGLFDSKKINTLKYTLVQQTLSRSLSVIKLPKQLHPILRPALQERDNIVRTVLTQYFKQPMPETYLDDLVKKYNIPEDFKQKHIDISSGEILGTLFLGSDPSDKLLSHTLYYLSTYPDYRKRISEELANVVGDDEMTLQHIKQLPFFRCFMMEVLRLKTPYAVIARDAIAEDSINGFRIPRGSIIGIMPLLVHSHEDYWDLPQAFLPERFLKKDERIEKAFIPFSAGKRQCVGQSFAMTQAMYAIARLLQTFDFSLVKDRDYSSYFEGVLKPREDILLNVELKVHPHQTAVPYWAMSNPTFNTNLTVNS